MKRTGSLQTIRLGMFFLMAIVAVAALLFVFTPSTHADVEEPCDATIAGVNIRGLDPNSTGDAIKIDYEDEIVVRMSSSTPIRSHKVDLEFARYLGGSATVEEREDQGELSFTETVDVSDFAWAGVGLYKVKGEATLADGSTCEGAALIDIGGRNPITTIAGGVAALVGVIVTTLTLTSVLAGAMGTPGVLKASGLMVEVGEAGGTIQEHTRRPVRLSIRAIFGWFTVIALMPILPAAMASTGGGSSDESEEGEKPTIGNPERHQRLPRATWLPRITFLGVINGLLAGVAGIVLLQQFSVTYPNLGLALTLLLGGAVIYGLVLPTLSYTLAWMRINRRINDLD